MIKHTTVSHVSQIYLYAEIRLGKWLSVESWIKRTVFLCIVLGLLHTIILSPSVLWVHTKAFEAWWMGEEFDAFNTVKAQAASFYRDLGLSHFDTAGYQTESHLYKMRLRLLLPFLTATLSLQHIGVWVWLLQVLLSGLYVWLAVRLTYQILNNRINTCLFMIGFGWLYPVQSAWVDVTGCGDFFAYLLLLAAVYTNRPALIILWLQLAFWTDERALVNAVYVFLWYVVAVYHKERCYRITAQQIAIVLSGVLYVLLRCLIEQRFGHPLVAQAFWAEFTSTYYENIKTVGFRIWSGFQSEWLLVALAVVMLTYKRRYGLALLLAGTVLVTVNVSFIVHDVNRSLSYGFLMLFASLRVLQWFMSVNELRRLLLYIMLTMLFVPLPNRLRLTGGYTIM